MATTSDYLDQLELDKSNFVSNLNQLGINASNNQTFTELVPQLLAIKNGDETEENIFIMEFPNTSIPSNVDYRQYIIKAKINEIRTNMGQIFNNCKNLTKVELKNTSQVTNMNSMFHTCEKLTDIPKMNTSQVITMNQMFYNCKSLISLDVSTWDTSNVTEMDSMFAYCENLSELPNLNTSQVSTMLQMFKGCKSFVEADFSNYIFSKLAISTGGVNYRSTMSMLEDCINLKKIIIPNSFKGFGNNFFKGDTSLETVIINRDTPPFLYANNFDSTPIYTDENSGYIYVPDNSVETYKSATNWSKYANKIKGISEYNE